MRECGTAERAEQAPRLLPFHAPARPCHAAQVPCAAGLLPEGLEWHQGLGPRTASAASLSQGLASRTGSAISLSHGLGPKVSSACSLQHYAAPPAHTAATTAAALAQAQAPLAPALARVKVGDASTPTEPQRRELLDRLVASLQLVQQGAAGAAAGAVCAGAGAGTCAGRASSPQLVLGAGTGKELSVSTLESTSPLDSVSRLDSVSSLLEQMSQLDLDERWGGFCGQERGGTQASARLNGAY